MTRKAVVVDDSRVMRMYVRKILEARGFSVAAEGENGQEAIALAKLHKPDVLMLDINMPIMTGSDAIEAILEASADTRVIMMTSVADETTVDQCLEKGAANYVLKSASADEIVQAITEAM